MLDFQIAGRFASDELNDLWRTAYPKHRDRSFESELGGQNIEYIIVRHKGNLIGFAKLVFDGGQHVFLLDPIVYPARRRQGVAREMIARLGDVARARQATILHVDFTKENEAFYHAIGFKSSLAGIMVLNQSDAQ